MEEKLGCRLPWDTASSPAPDCKTIEVKGQLTAGPAWRDEISVFLFQQLQLQDRIYLDLGVLDIEEVVNETGCLRPCQYTEYSLPSSPEQTKV